jgi:hypothetical protein
MATTLEEELSPRCLDNVADYFSLAEEEAEFQDLEQEVKPETSHVELKQLPLRLQYVFLNDDHETPVIISDKLSNDETQRLVATLEKYRSVIGYSLKYLKGIRSSLYTHRIPMEQDHKPIREHQRRLKNVMTEVVKKEALKLLKAGVIYHVSDSEWVSLVLLSTMRKMNPFLSGLSPVGGCVSTTESSTKLLRKIISCYPSLMKC